MKTCDLHTHSIFSDGTFTPEEIIDAAIDEGLSAVALTDHNTVAGLDRLIDYAKDKPIEIAPGVELSTAYYGREVHVLGLCLNVGMFDDITAYVKTADERKEKSNIDLAQKLNANGYSFDYSAVKQSTPKGKVNRANIAAELLRMGYISSMTEAFSTILSPEYGWYVPPERIATLDGIKYLSSIGAVVVLAHPLISMTYEKLDAFLPLAKHNGLTGIETVYSFYSDEDTNFAKEMCRKHQLLESGGSDFHGKNKPDIMLGKGKGNLVIPLEFCEKLKEAVK